MSSPASESAIPGQHKPSRAVCAALALSFAHAALLGWSALVHSPVYSEVGHLPAGLRHVLSGQFDLYPVNPPLVRMMGAVPVALARPNYDWSSYRFEPRARVEVDVGRDFLKANGPRAFWLYTLARWAIIPFSLLGAWTCFFWARALYGPASALVAMLLWVACPSLLGHGALLMPDVPAAACAVLACYAFRNWLNERTWPRAALAGLCLGIAQLTKMTLVILVPVWVILWLLSLRRGGARSSASCVWRELAMLGAQLLLGLLVLNMGYEFEGGGKRLGDFHFRSAALRGARDDTNKLNSDNRFRETALANLPVPLPENYLLGLDAQRYDFQRGLPSYLNGVWSPHGWWYFYLYALAIKLPLGTLSLIGLAIAFSVVHRKALDWWKEFVVLAPGLAILLFVSSQDGFSIHFRYVLPALPFFFIWTSKIAQAFSLIVWRWAAPAAMALCWTVASSIAAYPHSMSYFNELAGGMRAGPAHLLDSNVSWGQDLLFLKRWLDDHPEARPIGVAYFGYVQSELADIEFELPPAGPSSPDSRRRYSDALLGPLPGWYAVDVNFLYGNRSRVQNEHGEWVSFETGLDFTYFQYFEPVDYIGGSFRIYRIERDQANHVRGRLGLGVLP